MTNKLNDFIKQNTSTQLATQTGLAAHAKLQFIKLGSSPVGDPELIQKIERSDNILKSFFSENSETEVPIAGIVHGRFISRRIDRLVIDNTSKTIRILDYKTDTNPDNFREKYFAQIREYIALLKQIYPDYDISGYILWLHNWTLERI